MEDEVMEKEQTTESLSFAFVGDDIQVDLKYECPDELAMLLFSILSGALTEYVVDSAKELMTEEEYTSFVESLGIMFHKTMENKVTEPLIKPSQLFNMDVTK